MNPYLTFFHISDYNWEETPALFDPMLRDDNKIKPSSPTFYWFNDRYHNHMAWVSTYLYLFIKNPKQDQIRFRTKHNGGDFNGICVDLYEKHFVERVGKNLGNWYKKDGKSGYGCCEPGIMTSFSKVEPDLVIKFSGTHERFGVVVKPDSHKGITVCLFDSKHAPIKFTDIPEIVDIVPKINYSYPFLIPKKVEDKYVYEDWLSMIIDRKGG